MLKILVRFGILGIYILVCIALVVIILSQQGKAQGLGALTGSTVETYWSKAKGRSKEGMIKKFTVALSVLFFIISLFIDMNLWNLF